MVVIMHLRLQGCHPLGDGDAGRARQTHQNRLAGGSQVIASPFVYHLLRALLPAAPVKNCCKSTV
jgi:hypothetical protein